MVPAVPSEDETNDCEVLENTVVFDVANQATAGDNLEVKEQGSTRVLLTASSNLIEVHDINEAVDRSYQQHNQRVEGRQRGQHKSCQMVEHLRSMGEVGSSGRIGEWMTLSSLASPPTCKPW